MTNSGRARELVFNVLWSYVEDHVKTKIQVLADVQGRVICTSMNLIDRHPMY
jgi:hypothetical protein